MARPPKPRRFHSLPPKPKHLLLLLIFLTSFFILLSLPSHVSTILLPRANSLGRQCLATASQEGPSLGGTQRQRIVMVSLSDEGGEGVVDRRRRSFRGLMDMVRVNKEGYARRWGYRFVDAGRGSVDTSRPASWSKILAVRRHLDVSDWVFWNDADSMVTNPDISLESILQSALGQSAVVGSPDLVVTEDVNGINAGQEGSRETIFRPRNLSTIISSIHHRTPNKPTNATVYLPFHRRTFT